MGSATNLSAMWKTAEVREGEKEAERVKASLVRPEKTKEKKDRLGRARQSLGEGGRCRKRRNLITA